MTNEEIIFKIITEAGDAKSLAFEALKEARKGDFKKARKKLKKANKNFNNAHDVQTDLISKEANGQKNEVSILMVHAQDHLTSATLAKDLIKEMVKMQEEIFNLKENKQ
ncbi:PTS system cellobiose-specific IIA component [Halanaerobium saccharolyticum]|uniref:PTS system cellobiose-specific IIA component n=1 Tax=Halanaerobium saccharolyticum TaxID=43595 RepID=A0A4R7ZBD7_9FIRM|nr:PTS lactose/cellobiose transporter subunit IIA [Halanaerobium saccharolyticum]RAK11722.1 PTS system cellobiose-specific IIA component [Halanaerobium saccharolyticum]TDW07563.1 PTS system cellobiose-specific IIA component [Halanaerobium saccharolyticum]TDX64484.1 PTS system cellobiose-specific IIA component [Halanaerobium saccharolyticum]